MQSLSGRWTPPEDHAEERQSAESESPWLPEHRSRYRYAQQYVGRRRVLDVACGSGLGARLLLEAGCEFLLGVDTAWEALAEALSQGLSGLRLCAADATRLPLRSGIFDVVVSFETIEHLERDDVFVDELKRVLAPEGIALISTPNAIYSKPRDGVPQNPFHVREYRPQEFEAILRASFSHVSVLGHSVDSAYRFCPYWLAPESLARDYRTRLKVWSWKVLARSPWNVRERVWRKIFGQAFYPDENSFRFERELVEEAHVLLAICRK